MSDFETTARSRRDVLGLLGGLGAVVLVAGCGSDDSKRAATSTSNASTTTTGADTSAGTVTRCSQIPEETAGPFPGDGTIAPNVLTQDGIVRSEITSSFGSASGVAAGIPLTINLTVVDSSKGCAALPGAAVYVWHCNRDGEYSLYTQGVTEENYLRGVQASDANGVARFTSIFPGAYSGRWPHIHFEVFPSLAKATNGANATTVSQLALPGDICRSVYATNGYSQSVRNLAQTTLQTDMVFSDGTSLQTPTITGDTKSGYSAALVIGV